MEEWLTSLTSWLAALFQSALEILLNGLSFAVGVIIDLISAVVVGALSLISLPAVLAGNVFGSLFNSLPDGVGYLLTAMRFDDALGIVVSAVLVRLVRKVATLFQW